MDGKLHIETKPLADLREAPYNPRAISDEMLGSLSTSITRFGLVEPIVWNRRSGNVVGGHQRLKVLQAQGIEETDVVVVDLAPADERTLNLALNKITGDWDIPKLSAVLEELQLANADLDLTGFGQEEIGEIFGQARQLLFGDQEERFDAEEAMAQAEEATGPTRVQPGEAWQLGPHRLVCGDATDGQAWERLMSGRLAHAVVTDPPYAVSYCGGRAAQEERIARARRGVDGPSDAYWDDLTPDAYRDLLTASLSLAHRYSDAASPLYLWFASAHLRDVLTCLSDTGWQERNLIVWAKNNGAGALFAQYKHWYEPLFYAHKAGQAPRWHGPTNESTLWQHDKPTRNELHPTMKPLALIERAIVNATTPGQLVIDPFLGSGTAIIAAQRCGRICYGIDLEPRYCDVILRRWEEFTGEHARGCES
ncbi:MAG TPA: DNA methyltransferase [Armatimonadota bacterium]|nr:DNA methyltransferase [Armatimonadota bacterium]